MSWWSRLSGAKSQAPVVDGGEVVVVRSRAVAARLARPKEPNFGAAAAEPCEHCGMPVREALITTGGPLGDPEVWRELPVAVDGWACVPCGVFRYPRAMTPARMHELSEEGAAHGRAGRVGEAELCFVRLVWDWPGYFVGHINLAEATRSRLHVERDADAPTRRRLTDRMVDEYEAAIAAFEAAPASSLAVPVARAYLTVARVAVERRAFERAAAALRACLGVEGLGVADAEAATELLGRVEQRADLFEEAREALGPFIDLQGRPHRPIATGDERKRIADALDKLAEHVELAPQAWQAAWLLAKGTMALDADKGLAVWGQVREAHPDSREIARDFSLDLLRRDRVEQAREIARTIADAHADDATLWCNLAVAELLAGDLEAAERSVARSRALDATDPIAGLIEKKLAGIRAGAPAPRTLRELERG